VAPATLDVAKLKKIGRGTPITLPRTPTLASRLNGGYKVGVIDSTTYEEANSQMPNWIRQRSAGSRIYADLPGAQPPSVKSLKAIGLAKWLSYAFLIGGTPVNSC